LAASITSIRTASRRPTSPVERPTRSPFPMSIRLGSPTAVDIFVNGAPALVPGQPGQPLDLTFMPA
jgi:hypothetical protein